MISLRSKTSAELLLAASFVLGGVTGGVGHFLYQNHVAAATKTSDQASSPKFLDEVAQGLGLDTGQKEQLRVILGQSRERFRALSEQVSPKYDVIRNDFDQEVRKILRDDQRGRFEQILKDIRARRKARSPRAGWLGFPRSQS